MKAYSYTKCEACKGLGWREAAKTAGHTIALERCSVCEGEGELLHAVDVPDDWAPCTSCRQRCFSQVEHMEHNGGQPWDQCSACGLPPDDDDDEPTARYELPAAPMQRAHVDEPGAVIPVRWFSVRSER